jgi:hypothetical protein
MATCPGSLILHRNGTVAGCTLDELDDDDQCPGLELRHEGDPAGVLARPRRLQSVRYPRAGTLTRNGPGAAPARDLPGPKRTLQNGWDS